MKSRERSRSKDQPQESASGPRPPGPLEELRKVGDDLLAAGDEAIRRALSGNSKAFLAANRQEGGE